MLRVKIDIVINDSKVHGGIVASIMKLGGHTQDTSAKIAQTRHLLKKIKFEVEFELVREHKILTDSFQLKPLEDLITSCDKKAKSAREMCI